MRIVGGAHRGLALAGVGKGDPGAHLRPTTDRVREAIFNLLQGGRFGDPVTDARVLDLFAGTGALGLEALSRGAAFATFVDDGRPAGKLIRENLSRARRQDDAALIARPAARIGPNPGEPASLVFLDPPYSRNLGAPALAAALAGGWIAPGAVIVWEEAAEPPPPPGFARLDARRYGDSWVALMAADG
ncbi:16S rRNA (guanine(966)-N(2))-methyltransferase RsmD [Wenxinia marina]|uniref:RNA methyltransferase, RsmD family n=1 Tax=Wenxinia marina DSM 24838 TaxID=1123501 RepID=A0A0D0QET7_9RHOB|nr:16S rRNA (guanine(966)-N(2))-methyltransferase RsmD [Wenxinia marina]KIQ70847.1 RNA methyltransferase, RsmD family [Wenxinia marina DSM 24838]GGL56835.1 methyltransferase [Wenxinia marina]